ncbi:hypothetical protein DAPPUDRAFT_247874 [Daphnia pulex]|uniref:Uncharacterized protein n=1 Tax=Daphnia pulex TaxID=6669 RepID=E9GT17_DAPPU|nr:hypothetical protein DAPPUDRAFT_247874 [Daphnia pulex]|eukprot:EFX77293.1 hypothetical protein DAPPUDRAFT_247874 [Daphnia pulex]
MIKEAMESAHDPNNELKHEEKWKLAVSKMTSKDNIGIIHRAPTIQHILKQSSDFQTLITTLLLNFIIVTLLHQLKDFSTKEV